MSQEKVDKRKYEKKHRKELEKKRKITTAIRWIGIALVVGAIVGVPLGISIYNKIPKFVGDSVLEAYVGNYIDEHHSEDLAGIPTDAELEEMNADATESVEDQLQDAIEDAVEENMEDTSDVEEATTEE